MVDRGVSTVASYVLIVGIIALLTSTLIGGFAPFVLNQQQSAAQSTLLVFGNDLASTIDSADRLTTEASENGTVVLRTRLPARVGGSRYKISITQGTPGSNTYEITLRTLDFDANAVVHVRTLTPVEERTDTEALEGGPIRIAYDRSADSLVIRNV